MSPTRRRRTSDVDLTRFRLFDLWREVEFTSNSEAQSRREFRLTPEPSGSEGVDSGWARIIAVERI